MAQIFGALYVSAAGRDAAAVKPILVGGGRLSAGGSSSRARSDMPQSGEGEFVADEVGVDRLDFADLTKPGMA